MARTPRIAIFILLLVGFPSMTIVNLRAQVLSTAGHEHLTEVACVDVPPGEKRPEFGCFNVATVTGLHFPRPSVYWHLRAFPTRKAAESARVPAESWWRKTGECGSQNSVGKTALHGEATASPSSGLYSFPKQTPTLRSPPMPSCGLETIRECTHPGRKGGTCWRESSASRLRLALPGSRPEEP